MARKTNPFNPFGDDASAAQFGESVRASAQQIWLAGLGALAKAQAEGSKMFDALVKEGTGMQRRAQGTAEERIDEASQRMSGLAGEFSARAADQWGRLEGIFEERVAKALRKLGVAHVDDLQALITRIEALERAAHQAAPAARTRAARKSPASAPQPAPAKRPRKRPRAPGNT